MTEEINTELRPVEPRRVQVGEKLREDWEASVEAAWAIADVVADRFEEAFPVINLDNRLSGTDLTDLSASLVHSFIERFRKRKHESGDFKKDTIAAFEVISKTAKNFPPRIPEFIPDEVRQLLEKEFYPDGGIEMFLQDQLPIIGFAFDLQKRGEEIPAKWHELEKLYKQTNS